MTTALCLSTQELQDFSGYRRKSCIGRWLRENGIVFVVAADGWPRVDRQHYLHRMGTASSVTLTRSGLNLKALEELQNAKKTRIRR